MPALAELIFMALKASAFFVFCYSAYKIRLHAIEEYGRVIHEFDPWFNYRATEYLAEHGWTEFFHWFDHRSWYPLGRPVGTTIYPGMQITSVVLWKLLNWGGVEMSLNDVCVFVPAWFGVCATALLGLLTYECCGSSTAAVAAAGVMAVIPAHIMRSVGGGYDNESVAMTAMLATFYCWCRSLRDDKSWKWGIAAGIAYVYMVAAWGGYIFVVNMVGVHAVCMLFSGRYTEKIYKSYSLFYVIGTLGATRVPVVGWAPLKSLEQLGPFFVFVLYQLMEIVERQRRKKNMTMHEVMMMRIQVLGAAGAVGIVVISMLWPTGYFGPLSARVRGLFVRHTRTGNPLVDSVAEHQPASSQAYWQYLHVMCYFAPPGLVMCLRNRTDAKYFLMAFACVAYYFSIRMMRLILLMGPITSALSGITIGWIVDWALAQIFNLLPEMEEDEEEEAEAEEAEQEPEQEVTNGGKSGGKKKDAKAAAAAKEVSPIKKPQVMNVQQIINKRRKAGAEDLGVWVPEDVKKAYKQFIQFQNQLDKVWETTPVKLMRMAMAALALMAVWGYCAQFNEYSQQMSWGMSNPSIMFKAQMRNGQHVIIDDYRDAYFWLRDNTPPDSRVMAWWDYGYQIAGIANRITIADGNTWNHEHIATLGKCLSSEESAAHKIVRHLADYVLVWTGGGGDDLAKSPHMARIGNSVYHDICPGDPTCRQFGFIDRKGTPTPMMERSLLYKLHSHNQKPGVQVNPELFREVFTSKYNKVRIYKVLHVSKKSRKWIANPENRQCDAPGSWYCVGQYPPALHELISNRTSFKQLEDFNTKRTAKDDEYTREYMRRMEGRGGESREKERPFELDFAPQSREGADWQDTPLTTLLWNLVHGNKVKEFRDLIKMDGNVVHVRSGDGRGPLWWAYEYGRGDMVKLLLTSGADANAIDSKGKKPNSVMKMK